MAKKTQKQWFEHEEFWNNFGPIMFDAQRWAEAPDVAENIKKICGLKTRIIESCNLYLACDRIRT